MLADMKAVVSRTFSFACGVPDSALGPLSSADFYTSALLPHVTCTDEGTAISIASGWHLSGRGLPLVYLQNSGIGNAFSPLSSLSSVEVYGIPKVLLIGWRGCPGMTDEPQHKLMGRITKDVLGSLGIRALTPHTSSDIPIATEEAARWAKDSSRPVAILIRPGTVKRYSSGEVHAGIPRSNIFDTILTSVPNTASVVSTTGYTSRELIRLKTAHHRFAFLPNVGSMGHASQIALGIALSRPNQQAWCIDGDGSALMNLSGMAQIGQIAPKNYVHIIIDNGMHASVGGQPTACSDVRFTEIAHTLGYRQVFKIQSLEELNLFGTTDLEDGPTLFHIIASSVIIGELPRPQSTPTMMKNEFMSNISRNNYID